MMRNILLAIPVALMMTMSLSVNAQCVPDPQFTSPGIFPNTLNGIPNAIATVPYQFTITVVVPADTVVSGFILPIDSAGFDTIMGLPPGFSYVSNSPSNFWLGDSTGCVLLQGTGAQADIGVYPLSITIRYFVGGFIDTAQTFAGYYTLTLLDSVYAGIPDPAAESIYAFPNPADMEMNVLIELANLPGSQVSLINSIGQNVATFVTDPGQNRLTINTSAYAPGIYTLRYRDAVIRKDIRVLIAR